MVSFMRVRRVSKLLFLHFLFSRFSFGGIEYSLIDEIVLLGE